MNSPTVFSTAPSKGSDQAAHSPEADEGCSPPGSTGIKPAAPGIKAAPANIKPAATSIKPAAPDFDPVARIYRWGEYITFGRALERCRFHFLPQLADRRQALALGDGDGRFLHRLLRQNAALHADAVDSSSAMLRLLEQRCGNTGRLALHQADARRFLPPGTHYDLIVTHFFLDCFTVAELEGVVPRVAAQAQPGALWVVSEFSIPQPRTLGASAKVLIRLLYFGFRILTGLRTTRLPAYGALLAAAGFERIDAHPSVGGLLVSELWKRTG